MKLKSMKYKIMAVLAGIGLAGLIAGCNHSPEARAERAVKYISSELELDQQQTEKLSHLKDQMMAMRKEFKQGKKQRIEQLSEFIANEQIEQDKVKQWIKSMQQDFDSKSSTLIAAYADFHQSLNENQRQQILQHLEEMEQHHHGMFCRH